MMESSYFVLLALSLFCVFSLLPMFDASYLILDNLSDELSDEPLSSLFDSWAANHSKSYGAEERVHRMSAFRANLEYINAHNSQQPAPTFTLGLNRFADLTNEEYRVRYVGSLLDRDYRSKGRASRRITEFRYKDVDAPASVDWRQLGAVTSVKNQGDCGGVTSHPI